MKRAVPVIGVNTKKNEISSQRREELEKASSAKRADKAELLFNSVILVRKHDSGDYSDYPDMFKDFEGCSAIGLLVRYSETTGMVIDFSEPNKVALIDIEELENHVYHPIGKTKVTYNTRNKPWVRHRFLIKRESARIEKVSIDILVSELLALGWLSFERETAGIEEGEAPEIETQLTAVQEWINDRGVSIITRNSTEPYSLYGLNVTRLR